MLITHLRKEDKTPYGTLVAEKDSNNVVRIAWSRCHEKMDKFDKKTGIMIACGRLRNGSKKQVPMDVLLSLDSFVRRTKSYFKDAREFIIMGNV